MSAMFFLMLTGRNAVRPDCRISCLLTPAVGLRHSAGHGNPSCGPHKRMTLPSILPRPPARMVWTSDVSGAQEAFLVRVEKWQTRAHSGMSEAFAQEIDTDKHVERRPASDRARSRCAPESRRPECM